jgi:hypothetical protein
MAELNFNSKQNGLAFIVTIKRYNQWRVRLWLAMKLIRFAAWIAWVDIEINDEARDGELWRKKPTKHMWLHEFEKVEK